MQSIKDVLLESDIFAHSTLNRYRGGDSYATLTGGAVSLVLVFLFIGMFSNLMLDTFSNNIINSSLSVYYNDDPTLGKLTSSTNTSFMFAVGLTGINLSASSRYFDVSLTQRKTYKSSSGTTKIKEPIKLVPCTEAHWSGVSDNITKAYQILNFSQWLCPPIGQQLVLEGKYTSSIFQFGEIKIEKCSTSNSLFPGTTCRNQSEVMTLLDNMGQFTFNFYYINPVINAGQKEFLKYYLQDRNYFNFDTITGVSANLFFEEYTISTDSTILPWQQQQDVQGIKTQERAIGQSYRLSTGSQYFKFYLRKGSSKDVYTRFFQKLDQTLSYIGGLFGTLILLLAFLSLYSRYCYQLQLGDRIFKQNNGGSFGSQNFNFLVFIGYLFYISLEKLGFSLNWITMKKYHQCRSQCQKQLDIDLLFKKVAHFEEISKIVLEDYQQKMLLMIPKPTINEARINRKRFLVKSILYHQLDKKAREVHIDPEIFENKLKKYLQSNSQDSDKEIEEKTLKMIHGDITKGYKQVQHQDNPLSKKIMKKLALRELANGIVSFFLQSKKEEKLEEEDIIKGSVAKSVHFQEEQVSAQSLFRNGKVANLDAEPPMLELMDLARMIKKASSKLR